MSFTFGDALIRIEVPPPTIPGLTLVGSVPHLAAGSGWRTTFTFVNSGSVPLTVRPSLFEPYLNPLWLPIFFPQQPANASPLLASSLDQTISPHASFVMEIKGTGDAYVPYAEGSAQLAATAAVGGFAIFHYDPTQQEAVVPMEMRNAPSYLLAFDNTSGVQAGVALENVAASDATIPILIRDDRGTLLFTGSISLAANGHTSFVLPTGYPSSANIRGTVEFDTPTNGRISVLGIRYTGGTLTTIPVLANVGASGGLMAHLASGAGWQTAFVLVNTGKTAASATVKFFADNGSALTLPLKVLETGATSNASSITQTLAPGASVWIQSAAPDALLTGSAQLTTTGNVSGYAIFRYNPNGQEAVVPLESRNAGSYLIAFDNTNGTATGVAISAISSQPVSVPIIVRDDQGNQLTTSTVPLNANGHTSFTLAQQFPQTSGIRGTVEFDTPASAEISVLGIRSPPALTFTTLPPLAK
jgi:hypothetical protein